MSSTPRRRRTTALMAGATALLVAVTVTVLTSTAEARQGIAAANDDSVFGANARPIDRVPADEPARGLVYSGLSAAKTGPCVGGYEVVGTRPAICTHGPDATPPGLDARRSVTALPPLAPGVVDAIAGGVKR